MVKKEFVALFSLCTLFTLDCGAGYVDSRNWGERVEYVGARDGVLGSVLLEEFPAFWPKDSKLEITETAELTNLFQDEFRSKEPLQEGAFSHLRAPLWPSARLALSNPYPVYLRLGYAGAQVFRWKGEGALYDAGSRSGAVTLNDRGEIPWVRLGVAVPLEDRFFAGLNFNFAQGSRRTDFKKEDKDRNVIYDFSENTSFKGNAWGAQFFGLITEGWGVGFAFEGKSRLSGYASNLTHQSTTTAGSSSPNAGTIWDMPESWKFMVVKKDSRSRIFVGELEWVRYSKMRVNGRLVDIAGTGFFIDDPDFQREAFGSSVVSLPSYHDAVGIKLGLENPLTEQYVLRLGSQFWTHYADPRLITPTLSIGLGVKAKSWLDLDFGFSFSNRDYFGDGLLINHRRNSLGY